MRDDSSTNRAIPVVGALIVIGSTAGSVGASRGAQNQVAAAEPRIFFATEEDGVSGRLEIASIRPDGTGFTKLTRHPPVANDAWWTSDGRIVFESSGSRGSTFWRMRADGRDVERIGSGDVHSVSPSGRLALRLTGRGVEITSWQGRVTRRVRLRLRGADYYGDAGLWSHDSRRIALPIVTETDCCEYVRVVVITTDGSRPPRFLTPRAPRREEWPVAWVARTDELLIDANDRLALVNVDRTSGRRFLGPRGVHDVAISPDGRSFVYVGARGDIYRASLSGGSARRIARTTWRGKQASAVAIEWSPDGHAIVIVDLGGIFVVPARGGPKRRVVPGSSGFRGARLLSPDGQRFVFADARGIFSARLRDGATVQLTANRHDDAPVASPDGSKVAFVRGDAESGSGEDRLSVGPGPGAPSVYVMNADGSDPRRLGTGDAPAWSPDSRSVAFVARVPSSPPPSPTTARPTEIHVARVDGSSSFLLGTGTDPAWSPDGSSVASVRYTYEPVWYGPERTGGFVDTVRDTTLRVSAADGSTTRTVTTWAAEYDEGGMRSALYAQPKWSDDGSRLLLLGLGATFHGFAHVDVAFGAVATIPHDFQSDSDFSWSPTGTVLAFTADVHDELAVVSATGGGRRSVARRPQSSFLRPTWAPDAAWIAFTRCDDSADDTVTCDLFKIRPDGSELTRLTRTPGADGPASWSR